LGVKFEYIQGEGFFRLHTDQLIGTDLLLDEPSVTGTANIIFAAVMAKGKTSIYNAACEPYIQQIMQNVEQDGRKDHRYWIKLTEHRGCGFTWWNHTCHVA